MDHASVSLAYKVLSELHLLIMSLEDPCYEKADVHESVTALIKDMDELIQSVKSP
ncbi:hypothetical protein [Peribacillus tepidiphilus]|uniref:hypothetical protein n=1 Tax=Peribacillus tepidiphilus TaxID=2652445 RepID=UPI001291C60E|nr:hypothetical protein [Peribacillus tepidiphilus]